MKLTSDLLLAILREHYTVDHFGKSGGTQELPLPVFYHKGMELREKALYIARTSDLPQHTDKKCLFICCGAYPLFSPLEHRADIVYIAEEYIDVMTLFNFVQDVFQKTGDWITLMQTVLEKKAGIANLLKVSIPIFENRIAITDYAMRVIAQCEVVERNGQRTVEMSERFSRVPVEISRQFVARQQYAGQEREPFIVRAPRGGTDIEVDNYCINLFIGNIYAGVCSLCEDLKPLKPSDLLLFQVFADCVRKSLSSQQPFAMKDIVLLKTVLSDLLDNFPVSERDLNQALDLVYSNMRDSGQKPGVWHALTIKSANRSKVLPIEYICNTLEELLANSFAIPREDQIALFVLLEEGTDIHSSPFDTLQSYLTDMHFLAGISSGFSNLFKSRSYYLQSAMVLDMGAGSGSEKNLFQFEDTILRYMLKHSTGSFDREMILSSGLRALHERSGSVDYWETLKCYLDNECNASQTAQCMFLHRSTLLPRMETIQQYVCLDTPEDRLYLRMCLHLYDNP